MTGWLLVVCARCVVSSRLLASFAERFLYSGDEKLASMSKAAAGEPSTFTASQETHTRPLRRSKGCSIRKTIPTGRSEDTILWQEPGLQWADRRFRLHVPKSYRHGEPLPLVFVFHGWGETAKDFHTLYGWEKLIERERFIGVFPDGMDDCAGKDCGGQSWNGGGTTGSNTTSQTCDPRRKMQSAGRTCYRSCRQKKGECHPCDWTTCYDDVGFIQRLLNSLEDRLCLDTSRIFAWGCSNGGIFVHELALRLSGRFAAVAAACSGRPHEGFQDRWPASGPPVSLLLVGGREDKVIPRSTSVAALTSWWDGYYYADERSVYQAYARYNRCADVESQRYNTAFTGNGMRCKSKARRCKGGAEVVACHFDASSEADGHDVNSAKSVNDIADGPQVAWYFFKKHPLLANYKKKKVLRTATNMTYLWSRNLDGLPPLQTPRRHGAAEEPNVGSDNSLATATLMHGVNSAVALLGSITALAANIVPWWHN